MKRIIGMAIGIVLLAVSCAPQKQVSAEQEQVVRAALVERDFTIGVNQAYPMRGRSIPLTSSYSLTVKNDSVYSYLPYFGRGYNIPYGGGVGLNFTGTVTNYNVAAGKRGAYIVTFQSNSPDGNVEYIVDVSPGGNSTITVNSQNRDAIRFNGFLDTD